MHDSTDSRKVAGRADPGTAREPPQYCVVIDLHVAVCALLLFSACAPATSTASSASVARAATSACRDLAQVEEMLAQFAAAFNSGDEATVRSALSPELWALSLHVLGQNDVAYGRDSAVQHVVARQRDGDRLEFRHVKVNELAGWDGAAQIGPMQFALRRGQTLRLLDGKGALYCGGSDAGIKVLGLSDQPRGRADSTER